MTYQPSLLVLLLLVTPNCGCGSGPMLHLYPTSHLVPDLPWCLHHAPGLACICSPVPGCADLFENKFSLLWKVTIAIQYQATWV